MPAALIVPTEEFPPATPSTDHVTAVFVNPCTVAVNWSVAEVLTVLLASATDTEPTETVALALFVVSAALVAVTVCDPGWAGALYWPVLLMVPTVEFPPLVPSTDQVTAVLVVFCTVTLNWVVPPTATLADV
jgi:hypothetical protein